MHHDMEIAEQQRRIDAITWYHDFDFGNGLQARSHTPDVEGHRAVWRLIEDRLSGVEFRDKTVLDIGCWDGFWSFLAERRGARSVLAADDVTQNWGGGGGLLLAKELYGSTVEVNQNLSIYELASSGRRFDIILCFGVYYHLVDPFHAFAQIRHCCHPETSIFLEGDATLGLRPNTLMFDRSDPSRTVFLPTPLTLTQMLKAAYIETVSYDWMYPPPPPTLRRRLENYRQASGKASSVFPPYTARLFAVCRPFRGRNDLHAYRPPFGLQTYDDRWA